jgi:hypothetical protein
MQQTILALAAILAFSYYALSRHRDDADAERRAVSSEIERALTDAARNRLAEIEAKAFDEQDLGAQSVRFTPPTSAIGRDAGEDTPAAFDDIDDYASLNALLGGPETRVVSVSSARRDGPSAGDVTFALTVSVRYVNASNPSVASAVPTMAKEVHVRAVEAGPVRARGGRPPLSVDLRRVYTPAGMAALRP